MIDNRSVSTFVHLKCCLSVNELADLRGTHCPTIANKYHILLKRDDLMCKLRVKNTDVTKARVLKVGGYFRWFCS